MMRCAIWAPLLIGAAALAGRAWITDPSGLRSRLDQIVRVDGQQLVSCAAIAAERPVVVLALGQSNAGNHGAANLDGPPILLLAEGKCVLATDPLPGGTGLGGSIWSRLPGHWSALQVRRKLVVSVLGVDATSIEDWTSQRSPLPKRLSRQLQSMKAVDLMPHAVLWQQGETDARRETSAAAYTEGLNKLAAILDQAGSRVPIVMARSTVCRSAPNATIRAAMQAQAARDARFVLGPDTDQLLGVDLRADGCHFSVGGLDRAAQLWAEAIAGRQ